MFQNLTSKLNGGNIPHSAATSTTRDPVHGSNSNNNTRSNFGVSSIINNDNKNNNNNRNSNVSRANATGSGETSSLNSNRVSRTPEPNGEASRPAFRSGSGLLRSYSSPTSGLVLPVPGGGGTGREEVQRKRRLPGPAGNLPRLSAEEKDRLFRSKGKPFGGDLATDPNNNNPNSAIKKKMKSVLDGPVDAMFITGAWQDMMKELELPDYRPSTLYACKHASEWTSLSLSDIERNRALHRGKIEKLVVMVKDVSLSEIYTAVTLLDPSGEMPGTLHRDVLEQYKNNEIRAGTVLALVNVSVFSLQVSRYLMILPRNIAGLFQPHPPTITLSQGSSQERGGSQNRSRIRSSLEMGNQSDVAAAGGPSTSHMETSTLSSPQEFNSSPSLRSLHATPTTASRKRPILSPDWSDIPEDDDLSQLKTPGSPSQATLDLMNLSMDSQQLPNGDDDDNFVTVKSETTSSSQTGSRTVTRQNQENVFKKPRLGSSGLTPSLILSQQQQQQLSQDREVQFQSLRQNLGSSRLAPGRTSLQDDLSPTPMGLLGSATPVILAQPAQPAQRLVSEGGGLAAFAAPAGLRKRSSPTTPSQRANPSGPDSTRSLTILSPSSPVSPGYRTAQRTNTTVMSSKPSGPSQEETGTGSASQQHLFDHQLSSSDWIDEFSGVDFEVALDDDLLLSSPTSTRVVRDSPTATTINAASSQEPGRLSTTSSPSVRTTTGATVAISSPSTSNSLSRPQQQIQHSIDDDDDLDNLLDGLDESELYDL